MMPILSTTPIGKSVAKIVAKKFTGTVIERWTRYRAERFFEGFVETLGPQPSREAHQ